MEHFSSPMMSGIVETVETSIDFTSRLMTPFQDSDTLSLVFGLSALVLASIFSWTGMGKKGRDDSLGLDFVALDPALDENKIEKSIENSIQKIRDNVIYQGKMKQSKNKATKKSFRLKDYNKAVIAFEEFMQWSRNATRDNEIIDDLIDITISKSKGKSDPSDVLYHVTISMIYDAFDKIYESFDYYF